MTDENKPTQAKHSAAAKADAVKEAHAHQGKPTPTQEENDLARLGVPFETHEDDGSGPSPEFRLVRQSEAGKPGAAYTTRSAEPQQQPPKR